MIISLTGFMGSGKTTVGRIVADALGCPFLDLDDIVVKKAGKSIVDIFAQDGEPAFRAIEADCLKKTINKYSESTIVLALGGGTVTCPGAPQLLQEKTLCIWLKAPIEAMAARVAESAERPLANDQFTARYTSREPIYASVAHVTIETDGLTSEEIADEIIIDCL